MMMGPMHMFVYFNEVCVFVFQKLRTNQGDIGLFILGCLCCLLYGILHMGIPYLKDQYVKRQLRSGVDKTIPCPMNIKIVLTIYYFFYSLSNFMLMMIMMTMNAYVLLAVALGLTIGYVLFSQKKTMSDLEENHEICHS